MLYILQQRCIFAVQTNEQTNKRTNIVIIIKVQKVMRRTKVVKVSKSRAITIAMNHNCVSREIAECYTDSELKEVLKQLKLKADF